MPTIRFSLQPVLEYREHLMEILQSELAELERELMAQKRNLEDLQDRMSQVAGTIRRRQGEGTVDCDDMNRLLHYFELLRMAELQQQKKVKELLESTELKRQELVEAAQAKQCLEKLRERFIERMRQEELLQEGKTLDEIGVVRFHNRQGASSGGDRRP